MPGFNGRELTVDWAATTLVGIRTRGFSVSAEPVDVTTDDDVGERTLLPDPGMRSAEISVAGITSDEVLIAEMMAGIAGRTLKAAKVNLPSALLVPGNVTGDFFVSSFEITGEHDGAVEFSATLMSAGPLTYTASAAI
jgi:TP901-1 family phage major tail protein